MYKFIKLYLDSVWNFYFADDAPEKQTATLQFFQQVKQGAYQIFISDVVFEEIAKASSQKRDLLIGLMTEYQPQKIGNKSDHIKFG
jgi:hypothetical protein